jgi:hypothetical protein
LRLLAEGKIKWAFWPPGYDESQIPDANDGYGIWLPCGVEDPDPDLDDNEEADGSDGDSDDPETAGESSESTASDSLSYQTPGPSKGFELLSLLDNQ